jgi:hypothetical protein
MLLLMTTRHAGNNSRQLQQCHRDRLEFYPDDSYDRLKTCRDGYVLIKAEKRQRGNSLSFKTASSCLLLYAVSTGLENPGESLNWKKNSRTGKFLKISRSP